MKVSNSQLQQLKSLHNRTRFPFPHPQLPCPHLLFFLLSYLLCTFSITYLTSALTRGKFVGGRPLFHEHNHFVKLDLGAYVREDLVFINTLYTKLFDVIETYLSLRKCDTIDGFWDKLGGNVKKRALKGGREKYSLYGIWHGAADWGMRWSMRWGISCV